MSSHKDTSNTCTNMDLPLMANANDIRARHYLINLEVREKAWRDKTIVGEVIIFLEPLGTEAKEICLEGSNYNNYKNGHGNIRSSDMSTSQESDVSNTDFECILDCCDLIFDSVQEVVLPNSYHERFYGPKLKMLTFEERKEVEVMRNFFR